MLQVRDSRGRVYSTERDIVSLFERICTHATARLAEGQWHDVIRDYAAFSGLTERDLLQASIALAKFINCSTNVDTHSFADAWINSGLDAVKKPALLAMFFQIGAGTAAAFFNSVREAVAMGQLAPGAAAVASALDRAAHATTAPTKVSGRRRVKDVGKAIADTAGVDEHVMKAQQ